jgi:hypothetical protein
MKHNWKCAFLIAVFLVVVVGFIWQMAHAPRIVGIKIEKTFAKADMNPIEKALVFGIPDPDFEKLVNTFEPSSNSTEALTSLLVDCSSLGRTNYARILISHGANIDTAISRQANYKNQLAVQMLSQLRREAAANSTRTNMDE